MATASDRMGGAGLGGLAKASELKSRLLFTVGALIIYRLGTYLPIPGIDPGALADIFSQQSSGILGMFDMFSGGALSRMTIFALNIMPYITASIIMQLMTAIVPSLETLKKDGESGRKIINQYTRYMTVVLLLLRAMTLARSASDPGRGAGRCGVCVRLPAGCVRLAGVPVGHSEASRGRGAARGGCCRSAVSSTSRQLRLPPQTLGWSWWVMGRYVQPTAAAESGLVTCFI